MFVSQSLISVTMFAKSRVSSFHLSCLQGHPRLVHALAALYSPLIGQQVDPNDEILVSVGAYGALFCCVQGLINPGDEVCLF